MLKKIVNIIDKDMNFSSAVSTVIDQSERFMINRVYVDTKAALKRVLRDRPDIIIMDLAGAESDSINFIATTRDKAPWIKILVVTANEDVGIAFRAISQGASGYFYKKDFRENLLRALHSISVGGAPLDPLVAGHVIRSIQVNVASPLSNRESMILKHLMQGKTNLGIANDLIISKQTVKAHVRNIYKKLKVNSRAEAFRKAVDDQLIVGHLGMVFN